MLLRSDLRRAVGTVRHPTAGGIIGIALPAALLVGLLWVMGPSALPDVRGSEGAVNLGLLISAVPALFSYGVLFRAIDTSFLRRLGVTGHAIFWERAARLLGLTLLTALSLTIPFAASGGPVARPLAIAAAAGLAAWGTALFSMAGAARSLARPNRSSAGLLSAGFRDPELAATAPLVYAPILPLVVGVVAAGFVGSPEGNTGLRMLIVALLSGVVAAPAARAYDAALPRFAPKALEMAFTRQPRHGQAAFAAGRGITRLLPRRVAAVWVRDSTVGGRRYSWAARMVWPLALIGFFALARWGDDPGTRAWIIAAAGLAFIVQAGAIVALGHMERGGPRWVDRAVGLGWGSRLAGRWMWGWGLSLWLGVPLAIAWTWLAGAEDGWAWLLVGGISGGLASAVSISVAGWR